MRYIGILLTIISCILGLLTYVMLLPKNDDGPNIMLQFIILSPIIWFSIGVINMYIIRIFGSGIRNKLLTYTPEKNDMVVHRIAIPWMIDLVGICVTIWGWSLLPWLVIVILEWDSIQNLTFTGVTIFLITILPILHYLIQMYLYLHNHLRNVPILVLSDDKLRTSESTYLWEDIERFNRPNKEYIEVYLKKDSMEKYKTRFPCIISIHQEEISVNIFDLLKKMRAYKDET